MTLIMKATEFSKQSAAFKKKFKDEQALVDAGWYVQPKYDGCFGMAVIREDRADCRMLSRTGEDYSISCALILDDLHAIGMFDTVFLGEVWHLSWEFPQISGAMRRRELNNELTFRVHDLLPDVLETTVPYSARYEQLRHVIKETEFVQVVSNWALLGDVLSFAHQLKSSGGFDGAILKDPHAGYTIGNVRMGQLVKVKPTQSLDLAVTAWAKEPGEKTGRMVVTVAVRYKDVVTWVGSGVPHNYEPKNGDIIEVEFMGITADGALREPRFKGVRHDKTEQDT